MRSDVDQREVQRGISEVCDGAAGAAGLRRDAWIRQPSGDGELAVLPADEPEEVVVDRYVRELDAELARYNGRLRTDARLRLRVAVHFGRLSRADLGHAGPAPIAVMRLIDSAILRTALAEAPDANLALLVSAPVFEDTIASLATTLRPADFRQVRVEHKEFAEDAWLWVPAHDVHAMGLTVGGGSQLPEAPPQEPSQDRPAEPPGARPAELAPAGDPSTGVVHNTFSGQVSAPGGVFGMRIGGDR